MSRPLLAITTTIREPGPSFLSWLRYHTAIGFDRIFLFLDDPRDPCGEIARQFDQVTVLPCNDALKARYATLANYPVFARESATSVYARQMLHMELACRLAAADGVHWLLHIDADELFFTPSMDAASHFAQLQDTACQQAVYLNHEALPESCDIDDCFREVQHFKVNPWLVPPQLEPEIVRFWLQGRGQYFIAYDNGKPAVRVQPGLTARGPHRFSRRSGDLPTLPSETAWILHYANCGYAGFRRKYEMRGRFPDTRPDGTPVKIDFHLLCRDTLASGDEAAFRRLYESMVMLCPADDRHRQMAMGLVRHIGEPAALLQRLNP
jgi:hypothetical protein